MNEQRTYVSCIIEEEESETSEEENENQIIKENEIQQEVKEKKKERKKVKETIGDVAIQIFFLLGMLSQKMTIHFTIHHSKEIDAAFPHIRLIDVGEDSILFDEYLQANFSKRISSKELILITNNFLLDTLSFYGYTIGIQTTSLYDKIDVIEKEEIPLIYSEQIFKIGTELHNIFYDYTNEIVLTNNSPIVHILFH